MRVGVFDSGIGGLTVLRQMIDKHHNCEYIYYGDTLHLPYGEKSKEELLRFVSNIIDFLIEKKVDLIVIACGTVSSTIYNDLKLKYSIPIINVIDCTINKMNEDNIKDLAVLATSKTIESKVFSNNLSDVSVTEIACSKFVPYIEKGIGNIEDILDEYLFNVKKRHISNIVLGCTHYPLLIESIKNYLRYDVNFYDMGVSIADSININEGKFNLEMYFSLIDGNLMNNINKIIKVKYQIEERVL